MKKHGSHRRKSERPLTSVMKVIESEDKSVKEISSVVHSFISAEIVKFVIGVETFVQKTVRIYDTVVMKQKWIRSLKV